MQTVNIQISEADAVRLGLLDNSRQLEKVRDKIQQLGQVFLWLSNEEQETLIKMLSKQVLLIQAKRLNRSVKTNPITMQDIVEEVLKVRETQS